VLISIETPKKCADPQKTLRDGRKCIQPGVCQKKVLQWNLQGLIIICLVVEPYHSEK